MLEGAFLLVGLGFCPARFCGFSRTSTALLVGHGFKAALAPDLAALTAHLSHDLLNYSKPEGFSWIYRLQNHAARVLDRIKIINAACALWHTPSVAWMAGGVKA